jgi:hypothetical protein
MDCYGRLFATISLVDNDKKELYRNTTLTLINYSKEPWEFTTPFGPQMRVIGVTTSATGLTEDDYVQFNYGSITWKSNDTLASNPNGECSTGGEWDVRSSSGFQTQTK